MAIPLRERRSVAAAALGLLLTTVTPVCGVPHVASNLAYLKAVTPGRWDICWWMRDTNAHIGSSAAIMLTIKGDAIVQPPANHPEIDANSIPLNGDHEYGVLVSSNSPLPFCIASVVCEVCSVQLTSVSLSTGKKDTSLNLAEEL